MLAQIKAYKWTIIIVTFAALLISSIVMYYRLDAVQEKNKKLAEDLSTVQTNYTEYKGKVDTAIQDIESLRSDLKLIDTETAELKNRLHKLPKPTKNATNVQEIEQKANEISNDVFGRFK